jgi:transglutaminase-like putative cysteine protease
MRVLRLCWILPVLIGRLVADSTVHYEPAPAWIEASAPGELAPTPPADVVYGRDYLVVDSQHRVDDHSTYSHFVYRVTSEGSLQDASRLSWDFDPSYERLTLHQIRVIRGGVSQDRLRAEAVKVIQREEDLERHLLNGDLTAFVVLEDVRVGDVIDYAFTRQGGNPVFDGRYFSSFSAGWSMPVRWQRERFVVPHGRALHHREHGKFTFDLSRSTRADEDVVEWTAANLKPIDSEKESPAWFDHYPWIQLGEFSNWAEVARWADAIYAAAIDSAPAEVAEKSRELTRDCATAEAKTMALLRFVQQEVRYLGMELGAGSHRPNPPGVVMARRFGDCKDKTVLFCALMRAAGLKAWPALLNTDYRDKLADWLPTPVAFDHVIACVEDEAGRHWVDPTLKNQAGGFAVRGLPDYRLALIVRAGTSALDRVERPAGAVSTITSEEDFEVKAFDQPARLRIRTRSTGMKADETRREFADDTPEQISKSYVNYYASAYPGLKAVASPALEDDPDRNATVVEELYDVPKLWDTEADTGKLVAEFYPKFITDFAVRPNTTVRTTPLGVRHPVDVRLVTTVHLPEVWSVTPKTRVYDDEAFHAEAGITGKDRIVTMSYAWKSRRDFVPVEAVPSYVEQLNRYRNSLGYTLSYKKPETAPAAGSAPTAPAPTAEFRINWLLVLVEMITVMAAVAAAIWVIRRPGLPPKLELAGDERGLTGLGGWLILVGFGVVIRPFVVLATAVKNLGKSFNLRVWELLTTPGTEHYKPGLGALILTEYVNNTLLFAGSVLMVILFFSRKRMFPAVFIAILSFSFVATLADAAATQAIMSSAGAEVTKEYVAAGQVFVTMAIWIPYMLVSRRVALTFTR